MDRYAYYLNMCRLECRRPLGKDYFRLRYEDLLRARATLTTTPFNIDWSAEIPNSEQDFVVALANDAQPLPRNVTSIGSDMISRLTSLLNKKPTAGTIMGSLREILLNTRRSPGDSSENEPPDTAPGVREPLRPQSPLLSGSAARAYPPTEPPRWWAT